MGVAKETVRIMATSEGEFVPEFDGQLKRQIDWKDTFFIAAGVPALVLFSMGGISATIGAPAWLCWTLTVLMGFVQVFTYAEIAGLHPKKTGGTAVHGATAWIRYSKLTAPISLWSNWLAWTPVLAIGAGVGAGYLLSIFFPPDSAVRTWQLTLVPLDFLKDGLCIRVNSTSLVGSVILLSVFAMQHHGVLRTAKIQTVLTVGTLLPLLIVTAVPLVTGQVVPANFSPFTPLALDPAGKVIRGIWDMKGWQLFLGGMYIAAWSSYAFETAVCYMSELKDPARDTTKACVSSGLLCIAAYVAVPVIFQGVLGTKAMLDPGIADGSGVGKALAGMLHGGVFVTNLLTVLLVFTLLLAVMTSMSGSSRTLYQGGCDGWLPKYLGKANKHGAPTRAMWTDLCFNLFLLQMSDYLFVLAVSNVNYMVFIFQNLQAGWIHRIDNPDVPRPYRCPNWLLAFGAILGYVNVFLLGAGANVWGKGTLLAGLVSVSLCIPMFWFRHYVMDKGKFPDHMWIDLLLPGKTELDPTRAGVLPYVSLAGAVACCAIGYFAFGRL
jgi:amino acid transporter